MGNDAPDPHVYYQGQQHESPQHCSKARQLLSSARVEVSMNAKVIKCQYERFSNQVPQHTLQYKHLTV